MTKPNPPLAHLRVVDLTDIRGALAGRMLADLGADVLKVEPPGGEAGRGRAPFVGNEPGADRSLAFLYRNAGKRGATIDLTTAEGLGRLDELCAAADLLIENFGPDERERFGLSPGAIRARHPHLIQLSLADFGLSGPRAGWRLESLPAFAASGALYVSGFPDRPPCWLPGYLAHDSASVLGVMGALAAILTRARDGCGQNDEVSVQEAALDSLEPFAIPLADFAAIYPLLPTTPKRDADGPYLVLPTATGYIRVLPGTPRQIQGFLRLLRHEPHPHAAHGHTAHGHTAHAAEATVATKLTPTFIAAALEAGRSGLRRGLAATLPALSGTPLTPELIGSWLSGFQHDARNVASRVVIAAARLVPWPGATTSMVHAVLRLAHALAGRALRDRSRDEVLEEALRLGVPMAPVNTPDGFVAEAQTRARGYFRPTGFPGLGPAPFAPSPLNFSATPSVLARPAPPLGEDSGGFPTREAEATDTGGAPADAPALAGLRVISLGVSVVGPDLCRMLADLGAEVIKVESQANLDVLRRVTVELDAPNRSFMFNDVCRGQKSVCLDLHTPRGRELAKRLCATADIVVENNRGGVVESWGLDYENLRRVRPDIVYVSSQGYGTGGPLGRAPAYGPLNTAFVGGTWLWNHPDPPYPAGMSLNHPDHIAGKIAGVGILAALEHRRRTGEGQRIEVAQTEAAAYLMGEHYLQTPCTGQPPRQRGNAADYACPHGVYPCLGDDRWCAIAVVDDTDWERFCRCLQWRPARRLAELAGRLAAREQIDARVARWTAQRTAEEAAAILQAAGISAMVVQGAGDHLADGHLAARQAIVLVEHPELGPMRHVANAIRMSRTPTVVPSAAPQLGAHTEAVLTGVLGLGADEVRTLIAEGVCR